MTKTPWTEGPWKVGNRYTESGVYSGDHLVANTHSTNRNYDFDALRKQQDANAHLIAAAPDLYEALADLAAAYKSLCLMTGKTFYEDDCSQYQRSTAALAKARGEAQ